MGEGLCNASIHNDTNAPWNERRPPLIPPESPLTHALAIDTTSDVLSLALLKAGQPAGALYESCGHRAEQRLLGAVDDLLRGAGLRAGELDAVFVARGPGSFTGTRIGLAVALTFGQVHGLPVVGVDTLELLAAQVDPALGAPFHVLLNCARDEVYHAPYRWAAGELRAEAPIALAPLGAVVPALAGRAALVRRFAPEQPGLEPLLARLNAPPLRRAHPDGVLLLERGLARLKALGAQSPPRPAPIYLKSEAFRKWHRPA